MGSSDTGNETVFGHIDNGFRFITSLVSHSIQFLPSSQTTPGNDELVDNPEEKICIESALSAGPNSYGESICPATDSPEEVLEPRLSLHPGQRFSNTDHEPTKSKDCEQKITRLILEPGSTHSKYLHPAISSEVHTLTGSTILEPVDHKSALEPASFCVDLDLASSSPDLEPASSSADLEYTFFSNDLEPASFSADLNPVSSGADLEPTTSSADLESASFSTNLEPASSSADLNPASSSAHLEPTTSSADLELASSCANLNPASYSVDLEPTSSSADLEPASSSADLEPSTSSADLEPSTSSADLEPASSCADLNPASSSADLEPASSCADLDPTCSSAGLGPTSSRADLDLASSSADLETASFSSDLDPASYSANLEIVSSSTDLKIASFSADLEPASSSAEPKLASFSPDLDPSSSSANLQSESSSFNLESTTGLKCLEPTSSTSLECTVSLELPTSSIGVKSTGSATVYPSSASDVLETAELINLQNQASSTVLESNGSTLLEPSTSNSQNEHTASCSITETFNSVFKIVSTSSETEATSSVFEPTISGFATEPTTYASAFKLSTLGNLPVSPEEISGAGETDPLSLEAGGAKLELWSEEGESILMIAVESSNTITNIRSCGSGTSILVTAPEQEQDFSTAAPPTKPHASTLLSRDQVRFGFAGSKFVSSVSISSGLDELGTIQPLSSLPMEMASIVLLNPPLDGEAELPTPLVVGEAVPTPPQVGGEAVPTPPQVGGEVVPHGPRQEAESAEEDTVLVFDPELSEEDEDVLSKVETGQKAEFDDGNATIIHTIVDNVNDYSDVAKEELEKVNCSEYNEDTHESKLSMKKYELTQKENSLNTSHDETSFTDKTVFSMSALDKFAKEKQSDLVSIKTHEITKDVKHESKPDKVGLENQMFDSSNNNNNNNNNNLKQEHEIPQLGEPIVPKVAAPGSPPFAFPTSTVGGPGPVKGGKPNMVAYILGCFKCKSGESDQHTTCQINCNSN